MSHCCQHSGPVFCAAPSIVETGFQWSQRLPTTLHLALHPESLTLERAYRWASVEETSIIPPPRYACLPIFAYYIWLFYTVSGVCKDTTSWRPPTPASWTSPQWMGKWTLFSNAGSQSAVYWLPASFLKLWPNRRGEGNLLYPSAYYGQGDDGIARQDITPGSPLRDPLEGCTQSKVPWNERWNVTKKPLNLFVFLLSGFFSCLVTVSNWAKIKLDKGFLATLCVGKDVYLSQQRPTFTICQETIVVSTITVSLVSNCLISGDVSCSF